MAWCPTRSTTTSGCCSGWDDADAQVNRKVIEPLHIRSKGPRFGAGSFRRRWACAGVTCLEYADAVQASLRFQPAVRGKEGHPPRVLFDHLAPREPHLTGITAYYGPDMTFDAFVPGKKGAPWILQENTEAIQPLARRPPLQRPPATKRPAQPALSTQGAPYLAHMANRNVLALLATLALSPFAHGQNKADQLIQEVYGAAPERPSGYAFSHVIHYDLIQRLDDGEGNRPAASRAKWTSSSRRVRTRTPAWWRREKPPSSALAT